jgi:probable rRNA maturation factor
MRQLNRQYRGVDRTTDVLSFPQHSAEELKCRSSEVSSGSARFCASPSQDRDYGLPLGDIVVNLHKAARQAAEHGSAFNDELKRLLIHGLLHLIGHDHEKGAYAARKMGKISKELFSKIG